MTNSNIASFPNDAVRVCKLSGTEEKILRSRLLTLKECEKFLEQCLREANAAKESYKFFRVAELSARIILVACDVAIMTLEDKAGPAGMVVGRVYSGSKLVVSALSDNIDAKTAVMILVENKAAIASLAAEMGGNSKAKKAIDSVKNLVSLADTLWDQISGASSGTGGGSGIDSGIKTVNNQLARIRQQIQVLEKELNSDSNYAALFSPNTKQEALERQSHQCGSCGTNISQPGDAGQKSHEYGESAQAHHILHIQQGGTSEVANCVILCWSCHYTIHEGGHYQSKEVRASSQDYPHYLGKTSNAL